MKAWLVAGAVLGFCRTGVAAPTYSFYNFDVPGSITSQYGASTYASGINNAGTIVGAYTSSAGVLGFVFNPTTGSYTILNDPAGISGTSAFGINSSGQVVGDANEYVPGSSMGPGGYPTTQGFLYNPSSGSYTALPASDARGINDAGEIVGTYRSSYFADSGYLLGSGGSFTTLSDANAPPNSSTYADGINNAGQIVGYNNHVGPLVGSGFVFNRSDGSYTALNFPDANPVISTNSSGINDAGVIVGGYSDQNGNFSYVFDPASGSYTTLIDPSATIGTYANGINDSGQIVGTYRDSTGEHGFIATPEAASVPEPASLALLGSGIAIGIVARRRRAETPG